jgi:hypothetical protein
VRCKLGWQELLQAQQPLRHALQQLPLSCGIMRASHERLPGRARAGVLRSQLRGLQGVRQQHYDTFRNRLVSAGTWLASLKHHDLCWSVSRSPQQLTRAQLQQAEINGILLAGLRNC